MNNGKICVSVCAETADEFSKKIRQAAELADVIELRFDCLAENEFEGLEIAYNENFIITFRPRKQGGNRDLTLTDRRDFWNAATDFCGADFEEDIIENAIFRNFNPKICSYHDFSGARTNLTEIYKRLASTGADVVKIAIRADDITDAIHVWKLLQTAKAENRQIIPIAMGDAGKWTRILGPAYGAFMTYASLEPGNETAPGQISAKDLIETYRVKELNENTKVFGIIGDPVSQSLSPYMHNPAFVSRSIDAVFIPFLVKDPDGFIRRMVRPETSEVGLDFGGLSVTMPHKQAIMKHLDEIDDTARRIGAVNTVKIDGGKLIGYNTDAHGFITPLKRVFGDLRDARVAIIGAGGAARACVYALRVERADVTVFARDDHKAETFAQEFGISSGGNSDLKSQISNGTLSDFDIVVDATPFGMKGELEDKTLFSADELASVKFVYDLVTKPTDTPILREAKKANIPAIGGLEMLVAQGAEQFRIWTGSEAPVEEMKDAVMAKLK